MKKVISAAVIGLVFALPPLHAEEAHHPDQAGAATTTAATQAPAPAGMG